MEKELKKIQATIFGKSYTFATDDSEQQVLDDVASVDSRMKEIANTMNIADGYVSAVMLALHLTRELKQKNKSFVDMQNKISNLDILLDSKIS